MAGSEEAVSSFEGVLSFKEEGLSLEMKINMEEEKEK